MIERAKDGERPEITMILSGVGGIEIPAEWRVRKTPMIGIVVISPDGESGESMVIGGGTQADAMNLAALLQGLADGLRSEVLKSAVMEIWGVDKL